ncbi:DNA-dependent protein kinase catalytic subunit-like isoform X1 [Dreissena polymorpha]|uniref:DNA-dependent protein kinase catalytic subunit-like isoform X1 n=1 Tax=Dreissena polymorpha TaxID=45954 RepID=UPI002264374A|nr:DNA-dependent protein kinase catalytic subunit-like isoform X1 [Dreissena polymorpha]
MAARVETSLRCLHDTLGDNAARKDQTHAIVSDLEQICIHELNENGIDIVCSTLFDKEYGVVKFLSKAVTDDELQGCKAKLLEFLSLFLDKYGKKVLPYAVDLKDVAITLFSRDRYAKVKNAAVPLLTKVIELSIGSSMGKELAIDNIINKFFNELTKATKLTPTVKGNIYVLLGVLAEVYPEFMMPYSERLTSIYLATLKSEMGSKTRKPEMSIIAGCLEGLSCSLTHFTESAEEGSKNSYEIFKYARNAIDTTIDFTRYDVPKAGLRLFARHASQFSQYIIEDNQNMYSKLSHWSRHFNNEMQLLGMKAMESFLKQVCEMLKAKAKTSGQDGKATFSFFFLQFREIMNNEKATVKELSLAIKGYGMLAAPCKCFLTNSDVQFMFTEMLTKTEQQFARQTEDMDNKLHNLASYLESLASIVQELDVVMETQVASLECLMVMMLENIPNIHVTKHFLCRRAILALLLALMPKWTLFKQVLSGFVYQSLLRTFSHTPVLEIEESGESTGDVTMERAITYRDFMETWSGLFDAPLIKEFAADDITLETRKQLTDAIYREIITALLKILDKLDLTASPDAKAEDASVPVEETETSADPLHGVQARKPKDFQIFINLVDFCSDLLPSKNYEMFECWTLQFAHKVILLSTEHPLASGLYKLLAVCMKIANKLHYFDGVQSVSETSLKPDHDAMDTSNTMETKPDMMTCYLLVKKFSAEVLVRMKQYRDELLAACLIFILSLPKEVILDQMSEVVGAIQVTLKIGLSYLPLASVAMDALEVWSKSLPFKVMEKHYVSILPCLDNFLKTKDQDTDAVETNINTNKSKTGRGRKKLPVRLVRDKKDSAKSRGSQLSQIKQRVMQYLGQLGGSVNKALLANMDAQISERAIAWDSEKHLKFEMPFVDMKPEVYLDPFLPHVIELATSSSDRQTKVAACELLHSLVLFSIGCSTQQSGAQVHRASMAPLFKRIFPAMLKLSCDVELVARQLFEPLMMQVIHWYTGNKQHKSEETETLLDAIYTGIIQQADTAQRDFSARCLHEFLKWSIKQTSQKAAENNPMNAKSVLKRIFSYSLHPSPFKRLGAALAFNNIYTIFREEEPLVNMFTFELLVHLVESLAMAHTDEKSLGTQEQCSKALIHLEKIIGHKVDLLKVPHKLRTAPRSWSSVTLDIAVRWLTRQCGRPQTECRHACMKLSYNLCCLLPAVKTPVKFFHSCLKAKGPTYWIQRFEGGGSSGDVKQGIEGCPRLTDSPGPFSLDTTLAWFDNVLAALDCYSWVFGEDLLTPGELFTAKGSSQLWACLEFFVTKVALTDIEGMANLFKIKKDTDLFTPKEKQDFNRGKCTVIVRMLGLITIMLAKFKKDTLQVIPKGLFSTHLWDLVLSCVISPAMVGFNISDVEIMKQLPQEMSQTLGLMNMSFRGDMIRHFTSVLSDEGRNLISQLPVCLVDPSADFISMQQTFEGYQLLHQVDLLLPCLPGQNRFKAAESLLDNVFESLVKKEGLGVMAVTLTPSGHTVAKGMLSLALSLDIKPETLLAKIFDSSRVSRDTRGTQDQSHGDLFFTTFTTETMVFGVGNIAVLLAELLKRREDACRVPAVLTAIVNHVTRDRELRNREGGNVLQTVLSHWSDLEGWWGRDSTTDTQGMALALLTKLLLIDSQFVINKKQACFPQILCMYQTLLTDTRTKLSFKRRVLELLPFFTKTSDSEILSAIKSSLDRLVVDNFPLRSSELIKDSPVYQEYIMTLDTILSGFQLTGSPMLLEYLISIFCREPEHVHEAAIQAAIVKFTKQLPRDQQKPALDVPINIFLKTSGFPANIRRAVIERVCLTMLNVVHKSVVMEFFSDHILKMKDLIEAKFSKNSEGILEGQLISRMGCFQLLEVLYSRLGKDDVVGMNAPINKVFAGGNVQTGKELTSFISKQAHEAKGEDIREETTLLELRRQYHCAAYNLMIAFISRTQTELKFYTALLFEEKENKGQFLLENIIDKGRNYEFQVELQSPLERKKKFVRIHTEVRESRAEEEEGDVGASYHLASQYLADSSLSEDVSQYFSMSNSMSMLSSGGQVRTRKKLQSVEIEDDQSVSATVEGDFVELEMDPLNQHECMAPMIAVIKHMQQNNITPPVTTVSGKPDLPSWMEKLHTKITSPRTHYNIKLFIGKLVVNTTKVFESYAQHWLVPLTQLIVSGRLGNTGINYYVTDLIVTMLSWHKQAIPEDTAEGQALASRLVHFVVKNIYHDNRQVFRNNLEMLKTLLECWKGRIEIPYQEVFSQFSNADPKSKDNAVGIQVLGVILSCKLPPYGPSAPVDRERYLAKLASNMSHNLKTIFAAAAEVCGMVFSYLAERDGETEGSFHDHVANMMTGLHKGKPDTFITCVHRMHKHYAVIADRFMNKLLFMLPNLHGEFRTHCLEVVHSRIGCIENVYVELKSKGIMASLSHRDEATQQVSLKIVKGILAKLKVTELAELMPLIMAFISHPSIGCRGTMFEILMWIYDNYKDEDTTVAHEIMQQTKESLLKGLGDDDMHCRLQVQNFWSSESRLPGGTLDRLVAMLEAMYSPVTEQQYLSYATNLLLEMTSKSPDYQREIFKMPLSECKFSEYQVKSSWRHRHAAMTPMFATQTGQTQMEVDDESVAIRATQEAAQFTQTVEQGINKGPFNWLTQSSLDTFAVTSTFTMETAASQSSLLFTVGTGEPKKPSLRRPKPGTGFGQTKLGAAESKASGAGGDNQGEAASTSELFRLKRRFLKDNEQSRVFFAKRQTRIKEMREVARHEQQVRRESHVTMYRKYRSGDLPDVQIKYSYIIAPLQALAHRDSTVAKLLFSGIFEAIFAYRDEVKTEREVQEIVGQVNTSLDNVLTQSTVYYPPFIGCILDILYKLRHVLKVEVSNVGSSAGFSHLESLGIALLEEQLILHEPAEPRAAKRGKMDTPVSKDVNHWIELSRLYKSIGEYDVLMGIFGGKIGTMPITKQAIEAEARGDYLAARKLYDEAMSCTDWKGESPLESEIDLWEDCQMECLMSLAQWDTLEASTVEAIAGDTKPLVLTKVWEDTFLQEHYLPFLLKSKVKLLLNGDENQQSLLDFVDTSMKTPDYKLALESGYSPMLALMYLWQEDYDRARHYCNNALAAFLQDWSSTDILMISSRESTLQRLQPLIEMHEFLTFMADEANFSSPVPAQGLVCRWNSRCPHQLTDPVGVWDDVILNRSVYLDHISSRLRRQDDSQQSVDGEDMFLDIKLRLRLAMAQSCTNQNNFALTLRLLKETYSDCKASANQDPLCMWTMLYASTHYKKVETSLEPWSEDTLNSLFTAFDQLGKLEGNDCLLSRPSLVRQHHTLKGRGRQLVALGIQDMDLRGLAEGSKAIQKLLHYTGLKSMSKIQLTEELISQGFKEMRASLAVDNTAGDDHTGEHSQELAYLATAKYCDTILRMKSDGELEIGEKCIEQFPETLVVCLLRSIKLDSTEARQRFPRLLQILELHPQTKATFIAKCADVPSWMFILWISQMLALMDKQEAPSVYEIILRITQEYPQAVVYPMKLSLEGYTFGSSKQDKLNKDQVDRIVSLLGPDSLPLTNKFISALECFGQPDQEIQDALVEISKMMKKNKKDAAVDLYKELYNHMIDYKTREDAEKAAELTTKNKAGKSSKVELTPTKMEADESSLAATQPGLDIGSYAKKFADKFKAEFDKRFGKGGKDLKSLSLKDFIKRKQEVMDLIAAEVKGKKGMLHPPSKLAEYSKWMSDFNSNLQGRNLEIPGQYTGVRKPLPEYHVKIAGFDQTVKVMTSLRKPKRITIRGNDERDYHFLVKGGEDLRQDQRIEQLFYIMNQVFLKNPVCSARKLQLKTYQVIPMTTRVGLIEWMDNTIPLKDFIRSSLTDQEHKFLDSAQGPTTVYGDWIKKVSKNGDPLHEMYNNIFQKYSYTETVRNFTLLESKVPWDLLRRSFHKLSTSPEAFHVLRSHCMKTHAMLSICQYILGIGDRHLSNFMVNLNTGEMIGIDFGHAFGSATQFLQIPELMPFRMTRQLRNLMMPLQVQGLVESTMIHVLRALRSDSDLLLNTMDIFVKEPSLDWKQNAEKQLQGLTQEDAGLYEQEDIMEWYPKEKIHYVKRKLRGANSAYITRDELKLGHVKKPAYKDFENVVLGHKDNERCRLPENGLTVEQQVAVLLDQATDPNILGRTWMGWEPWM